MATRRYRIPNPVTPKGARRQSAAALAYRPGVDTAPRVVASGEGRLAEAILALARENGVPIHEDPALAAALASLNPGEEIPPELYVVVSEVLVYIYRLTQKDPSVT
jgi:flagellar biosynthesis protein